MPLPLTAILTYSALAGGGLSPGQLAARMALVKLYSAPPSNAPQLPGGTSDAVFDVLFGANIQSDVTAFVGGGLVTRTLTLGLRPAAGAPTASSFVSLGNAGGTGAPTNNPPFPSPLFPFAVPGAGPKSAWTGSIVSSSTADFVGSPVSGSGARTLRIFYLDVTGAALHEDVALDGTTPVNLVNLNKYIVTDVEILTSGPGGAAPRGKINLWSGPVDPITGYPTGTLVGYLPNSYFTNFSFQQLLGWTVSQVADPRQAYQLVRPDYHYPDQTVITSGSPPGVPPPPPSKYLLDYPPPSSVANPNPPDFSGGVAVPITDVVGGKAVRVTPLAGGPTPGPVNDPLLTPQPNFTNTNQYLSNVFYGGNPIVPTPFQGLGLGAFGRALNMPVSRVPFPGTVSMTVALV
jgi:hypothetical protein